MSTDQINFINNTDDDVAVSDVLTALQDQGLSGLKSSDILSLSDEDDDSSSYEISLDHRFSETVLFPELVERTNIQDLGGTASLSLNVGDSNVAYQTTATFKMVESGAGYNNTLGAYTVDADGTIKGVEIAFENVKDGLTGQQINNIDKQVDRVEKSTDHYEKLIARFEGGVEKFQDRIDNLDSDHKNYEKLVARYEKIVERYEKLVEKFEGRIEKNNEKIQDLELQKADLVAAQEFEYVIDGSEGKSLGMFIIANGDRINSDYKDVDLEAGELSFVYDLGGENERLAQITDDAADVTLIHTNGDTVTVLKGNIFHSTERGAPTNINPDNAQHAVSGLAQEGNSDTLRIGFEDLKNLGDADFNDVVFDVTIEEIQITLDKDALSQDLTITGNSLDNMLEGLNGDDIIFGNEGDDTLIGNAGRDVLYGNDGADIFKFIGGAALSEFDIVRDFSVAEGDVLDVSSVVTGFTPGSSNVLDWIKVTEQGGASYLRIDADGGRDDFSTVLARLDGVTGLDVTALFNSGQIAFTGDQVINGTSEVDVIYGLDGDDVITTGEGRDVVYGGVGADTFVFESGNALTTFDVIRDFNAAEGDILDLSGIITNFTNDGTSNIFDYVRFTEAGGNTFLRVDADGGRDDFSTIVARLDGVTGLDALALFNNEQIAVTGDDYFEVPWNETEVQLYYGFDGNDTFNFTGNVREIADGGSGADIFRLYDNSARGAEMDIIRGFDANEGDVLQLSSVISTNHPLDEVIDDYVRITEGGGNSFVRIDLKGEGNFTDVDFRLDGATGLNVQELLENGNIVV